MIEQFFPKASYNFEKLLEEVRASFALADLITGNGFDTTSGVRVQMPDGTQQTTWDAIGAIIAAHNASVLTATQQEENARQAALNQARDYLRKQLLNPSPNVATIYSNVKAFVDNNPYLLQIVSNELSLANLAFGWTIASMNTPANNTDRARYLFVIQTTLGILA